MKPTETRCSCDRCVSMCKTRPCLPTPEEAKHLDKTMQVDFGGLVVTSPAMVGQEGQTVSGNDLGCCVYLKNDLCELHSKGLKPLEGRIAHHSVPWFAPREYVLSFWLQGEVRMVDRLRR